MSYLEASIVILQRRGKGALFELDAWIESAQIEIVTFDISQAKIARQAYVAYGKGRHPAALNFGDCASYALASQRSEPLLFKGNDFTETDVQTLN